MLIPQPANCLDMKPDEVLGRNISMLMPPPDSIQHDQYLHRYDVTHKPRIIGLEGKLPDLGRMKVNFQ